LQSVICNCDYFVIAIIGRTKYRFVLPLWNWHAHENNSKEPAILFSINDRPAIEALGYFREEAKS